MLKGIGKLVKAGVALGKPFAVEAVKRVAVEAVENVVPGGDLGMDIGRAVLERIFDGEASLADRLQDLSAEEAACLAELLSDVLALADVANNARVDGELSVDEIAAVFESVDELGQETESFLTDR